MPSFYNPRNRDPAEAFERLEQIIRMKIKAGKKEIMGYDVNNPRSPDADATNIEIETLEWVLSQMRMLR